MNCHPGKREQNAKRSKSDRQHTTNLRLHHHAAWRFALFFLGGNSSPFIGGLPTPARLRTFSAFGISARAARAVKWSAVRSAESFSATATLISWLSATPSASASLRASSRSEG